MFVLPHHGLSDAVGVVGSYRAEDHPERCFAVAAAGFDQGQSPILPGYDEVGYLIGLCRDDDQKLAVISRKSEYDGVDQLSRGKDRDHGVEGVLERTVDNSRQRDYNGVADQHDRADAQIRESSVQVAGDDIGAAGTASAQKDQSQSRAGEDPAEDSGDDEITAVGDPPRPEKVDQQRYRYGGDNGSKNKPPAALYRSPDEQRDVEDQRGRSDRRVEQMVEHSGKSGNAAGGDVIGGGKKIDRQRIDDRAEGYHQIVPRVIPCSVGLFHSITLK